MFHDWAGLLAGPPACRRKLAVLGQQVLRAWLEAAWGLGLGSLADRAGSYALQLGLPAWFSASAGLQDELHSCPRSLAGLAGQAGLEAMSSS